MHSTSPWHRGERLLQQRLGVAEQMAAVGQRVIRDYMPEQHRQFYAQLPFLLLGGVDAAGWPWAGILEGTPGFVQSPDPRLLTIAAQPARDDPLRACLSPGAPVGVLGIELPTRRRNRMNGELQTVSAAGLTVAVTQSFGNCPKYIQQRDVSLVPLPAGAAAPAEQHGALDEAARQLISGADTLFVASSFPGDASQPAASVDVSHRGGKPGFVRVEGNRLTIPDFSGNRFFNTLGNLLLNPKAGLLFIDFASGDLLQLTGRTEIVWQDDTLAAFAGCERAWHFTVEQMWRRRGALALRGQSPRLSPSLQHTGSW
ncbi:pyridoxamine 5'-phosphate oxidase family protein [Vogesella oryzae]|uniref:pyridoxamine 5'-phosphate oxidase family protein n=1 Tax=Vogesella oryzae TaxID=1735285 RepID=UPI001581F2D2|nr:pyridoxamine 5'-phosphate oxidase family protein [Vogesella oryzae]